MHQHVCVRVCMHVCMPVCACVRMWWWWGRVCTRAHTYTRSRRAMQNLCAAASRSHDALSHKIRRVDVTHRARELHIRSLSSSSSTRISYGLSSVTQTQLRCGIVMAATMTKKTRRKRRRSEKRRRKRCPLSCLRLLFTLPRLRPVPLLLPLRPLPLPLTPLWK